MPHVIGEAILILQRKLEENSCIDYERIEDLPRKYPALKFVNYDKSGFMTFFSGLLSSTVTEEGHIIAGDIADDIGRIGPNDFLLLLALYADSKSSGLITTDRELIIGTSVSRIALIYGNDKNTKSISQAPHEIFDQCQHFLEKY